MSDVEKRLAALSAAGLRRQLRTVDAVSVSSNDYLDLSVDASVRSALIAALTEGAPIGSTGSRLLSGQHPRFTAIEERFAAWQGAEASLLYATGFAANQGLLGTVLRPGHVVVSDALNHASLIDAVRLTKAERRVVPHLDLAAYDRAIEAGRPTVVVVESVYSMDGTLAPLQQLAALCQARGARLVVDEAHATGLYGPTGAGRIEAQRVRDQVFASVHTAGKALGVSGAFVVGSAALMQLQLHDARAFVFSTAPPPFLTAGLHAALDRIRDHAELRARPVALAERLRAALAGRADVRGAGSPIVPVVVGTPEAAGALSSGLLERGWDARAIRPPTVPVGTSRVRLVMRAGLTEAQVDTLAAHILELL
ncbi:MAG: 8-amino-7-oxononanoate synthase [Myxococcales bacterium]|nr:8-amino-7-oxononanoate synthase [Myxococcales bacterium]